MSTDLTVVDSEIATIEKTMRADFAAYQSDRDMQGRYLALLESREAGATPPAKAAAHDAERRELEKLMRDPSSAYWKGPYASRNQARYRALIDREPASEQSPTEQDGASGLLEIPHGLDDTGMRVLRAANDILRHVPVDTRQGFEAGFNALPTVIIEACRAELAAGRPWEPQVLKEELDDFATLPEGRELVQEWGQQALTKFSRVRGRIQRWVRRMPAEYRDQALNWLLGLSPTEAAAVYRIAAE